MTGPMTGNDALRALIGQLRGVRADLSRLADTAEDRVQSAIYRHQARGVDTAIEIAESILKENES